MTGGGIDGSTVEEKIRTLRRDAEAGGYILNPDTEMVRKLAEGLCTNEERYGYSSCPCRLASGSREDDRDIICPCDYRDPDLEEFGACYCALYVSPTVARGEQPLVPVPERRPPRSARRGAVGAPGRGTIGLAYPVWRCRVCGYLCAREKPPLVCPVCKASQDRFERFM